jgi:hypothetical protein
MWGIGSLPKRATSASDAPAGADGAGSAGAEAVCAEEEDMDGLMILGDNATSHYGSEKWMCRSVYSV